MSTLYASFLDASAAERAAGALLDLGAKASDISIIANEVGDSSQSIAARSEAAHSEDTAKHGISTTTAFDAAAGAVKGATIGVGVGIMAAAASLIVPGFGLIAGGGALALAMAGGAATIAAGGAAGAVVGYLKDQGVPEDVAIRYSTDFVSGGSILAIVIPSGTLTPGEIEGTLAKYGATNAATYNSPRTVVADMAVEPPKVPLNIDNPSVDPIARHAIVDVVETPKITRVVDAATGETRLVASDVETVVVDPISGEPIASSRDDVKLI